MVEDVAHEPPRSRARSDLADDTRTGVADVRRVVDEPVPTHDPRLVATIGILVRDPCTVVVCVTGARFTMGSHEYDGHARERGCREHRRNRNSEPSVRHAVLRLRPWGRS
jgi:hypothetical protein